MDLISCHIRGGHTPERIGIIGGAIGQAPDPKVALRALTKRLQRLDQHQVSRRKLLCQSQIKLVYQISFHSSIQLKLIQLACKIN